MICTRNNIDATDRAHLGLSTNGRNDGDGCAFSDAYSIRREYGEIRPHTRSIHDGEQAPTISLFTRIGIALGDHTTDGCRHRVGFEAFVTLDGREWLPCLHCLAERCVDGSDDAFKPRAHSTHALCIGYDAAVQLNRFLQHCRPYDRGFQTECLGNLSAYLGTTLEVIVFPTVSVAVESCLDRDDKRVRFINDRITTQEVVRGRKANLVNTITQACQPNAEIDSARIDRFSGGRDPRTKLRWHPRLEDGKFQCESTVSQQSPAVLPAFNLGALRTEV